MSKEDTIAFQSEILLVNQQIASLRKQLEITRGNLRLSKRTNNSLLAQQLVQSPTPTTIDVLSPPLPPYYLKPVSYSTTINTLQNNYKPHYQSLPNRILRSQHLSHNYPIYTLDTENEESSIDLFAEFHHFIDTIQDLPLTILNIFKKILVVCSFIRYLQSGDARDMGSQSTRVPKGSNT